MCFQNAKPQGGESKRYNNAIHSGILCVCFCSLPPFFPNFKQFVMRVTKIQLTWSCNSNALNQNQMVPGVPRFLETAQFWGQHPLRTTPDFGSFTDLNTRLNNAVAGHYVRTSVFLAQESFWKWKILSTFIIFFSDFKSSSFVLCKFWTRKKIKIPHDPSPQQWPMTAVSMLTIFL